MENCPLTTRGIDAPRDTSGRGFYATAQFKSFAVQRSAERGHARARQGLNELGRGSKRITRARDQAQHGEGLLGCRRLDALWAAAAERGTRWPGDPAQGATAAALRQCRCDP